MFSYPGNIHIHSTYSDGSGSIEEISAAASSAALRYLIINDHETLAGYNREAIHNGVVVLVGAEINRSCNHYLAIGIDNLVASNDSDPQDVIDRVRESGGLGFLAHPFERGSPYIEKGKAYPWVNWPVFGFNGFELWNYSSYWRGLHPSLLRTLYWFFFNRKAAMKGPSRSLIRLWDCYNCHGHRIAAIGGTDAHAYIYRFYWIPLVIFSYRYLFNTINTYIVLRNKLSGHFSTAKSQILGALRAGSCYISYDGLSSGEGFTFSAVTDKGIILMGEETDLAEARELSITAPGRKPLVRLICNGKLICEKTGNSLTMEPSSPGVYRVEVYHRPLFGAPRPWIYSNPIFIGPA
jgi:hypothetical protein